MTKKPEDIPPRLFALYGDLAGRGRLFGDGPDAELITLGKQLSQRNAPRSK